MFSFRSRPFLIGALASLVISISAYTIKFQNSCPYTVWAAIGKAPDGKPDPSVSFGKRVASGASGKFEVDDNQLGIRAWGRTGCDGSGSNCQTGACEGGLVCNDAGTKSRALLSEYNKQTDGRIEWHLSYVSGEINIPTRLTGPDGQTVYCAVDNCPNTQALGRTRDLLGNRYSAPGGTYTHEFCG